MKAERLWLVAEGDNRRAELSASLAGLGFSVAAAAIPPRDAGEVDGLTAVIVDLESDEGRAEAVLEECGRLRPTPPIVALASAARSSGLLPLLRAGKIVQVADPAHPAALYSAVLHAGLLGRASRAAATDKEALRKAKKELAFHLRKSRELEEAYDTTLENFMAALDLRDVETYGHSKTVARYSHVLAEALGISDPRALENIRKGALLHDSGKMAIPDSILKKPGPLTPREWGVIKRHPALGYGLVRDVKLVPEVGHIILCHHERYDGTGYPKGLKGDAIPLEARIFAAADTVDAVTSHRPYRTPRDFGVARRELTENSGTQFDPRVVEAFCRLDLAVWEKIRFETTRILPPLDDYRAFITPK